MCFFLCSFFFILSISLFFFSLYIYYLFFFLLDSFPTTHVHKGTKAARNQKDILHPPLLLNPVFLCPGSSNRAVCSLWCKSTLWNVLLPDPDFFCKWHIPSISCPPPFYFFFLRSAYPLSICHPWPFSSFFLLLQCGYFIVLCSFLFFIVFYVVPFFFSFSPFGFSNVYPRGARVWIWSTKSDSLTSLIIYPGRPIKSKNDENRTGWNKRRVNIETYVTWIFMFCNNTTANPQRVLLLCCCITSVPVSQCISPAWPETIWHKKGEVYLY